MNNLVNTQTTLTMSSREIAELCDKRHDNIVRDIRQICTDLKIEVSKFQGNYKDSTGRKLVCYNLPKREYLILVSGYSTVLRAKIIDRWIELESQEQTNYDNDTRFDFPKDWDKMSPTKKAVYIYGPLHMHLVKAFTQVEESKHYKALIKEAKQVLERSVVKAA
ncbi:MULTISPECIES: Rha family transcriptional regulator [unclassified Bartonella]|uniref:Rha family transcriptional regulator n=1 Tax=unclassified Bartonella TaxID=2645622 RepID=UPI0035D0A690